MQDELGSPLRVSGYREKEGSFIGRSEYLTYGYDEFGNDFGKELNEADMLPVPGVTSDYEFKNSMEVYNSKEYIKGTNCYAYAFDMISNPITGEKLGLYKEHSYETPWAMQPGMLCNKYNETNYYRSLQDEELFISIVKEDAEKLGLEFQEYKAGLTGGYIVAIAIDSDPELPDYHFYRENGDGTWSCKRGRKKVDIGIENPQSDAYDYNYRKFLGYYYITEKEQDMCDER